jgi:predicted short-subunit dehydrogenase-like oxidoreductase (DUF2520 family)
MAAVGSQGKLPRIGFVGAGAVATTLAQALAGIGEAPSGVSARVLAHAEALATSVPGCLALPGAQEVADAADLIFLAVPDDLIAPIASSVRWQPRHRVVHFAGARSASELAAASRAGAQVAALHPLMTFPRGAAPTPAQALAKLQGATWAIEASDEELLDLLSDLTARLGGSWIRLTEADRVPYHLAAVLASNYVVTLLASAVRLWEGFVVPRSRALPALARLTRAALDDLTAVGLPQALTGPVARGDVGTVRAHLAWQQAHLALDPRLLALRDAYAALARLAIPVAVEKGSLSREAADELLLALRDALATPLDPPRHDPGRGST